MQKTVRKFKNIDIAAFSADIASSMLCASVHWDNIDALSDCFNKTLTDILDKFAPLKTRIMINRPKVPWFNDDIKQLKRQHRHLEKRAVKTDLPGDWNNYHKVRNQYSAFLKSARVNYYSNLIDQCAGDSRKLFRVVNSLCREPLETALPEHTDPTKLANEFGTFFLKKTKIIKENLDKFQVQELRLIRVTPKENLESFSALSIEEVSKIVGESSDASCLLDPVPTWLLKSFPDVLAPPITEMVNLSLLSGHVPENWRTAVVFPLLKKPGLDLVYKNFRLVNNLPFISKVVEKASLQELLVHREKNSPLPKFHKYHSTETALLKVQNDILMSRDNKAVTLLVLLDLSSAFDTIERSILLNILQQDFGVVGTALNWFDSFLSGRKQRILVGDKTSDDFNLNCGVPQGSCMGPILFTLYVSRLFNIISQHLPSVHGYADDTEIYLSS